MARDNWTAFLPEAQKWVSERYSVLHGHPHKKPRKPRKIRLHKAHIHNALISHAKHPKAAPAIVSRTNPFRRTRRGSYNRV